MGIENLEEDPTWHTTSRNFDLTTESGFDQALTRYLLIYADKDVVFESSPLTGHMLQTDSINLHSVPEQLF